MPTKQLNVEDFYNSAFKLTSLSFRNAGKTVEKNILLAGLRIRLRFAGDALIGLLIPAISHLLIDIPQIDNPDYIIHIWDSESANSDFPKSPCPKEDVGFGGDIKTLTTDRFETAYFSHASMLTLLDHQNRQGVVCLVSSQNIPSFELACPFRAIFSWILRRHETIMVHAGAVATYDGSILIGGNSGAGKSSTAFRCLLGGLNYLGDDICAVSAGKGFPVTHSIYSSGKTFTKDLAHYSELSKSRYGSKENSYDKEIFFFNEHFAQNIQQKGDLRAVVIPFQDTSLEIGFIKLSSAKALSVICSSTKSLLPDAGNEIFRILSTTLHQVPCYQFNLGDDPKKIAPMVAKFIANLKNDGATTS